MPKTTVERATRTEIDPVLEAIASFSEITLSDRREAWLQLLAELITDAHEAAHRENERRWATEETAHVDLEAGEEIAKMAVQVRRNWRLMREVGAATVQGQIYLSLSQTAANELFEEFGFKVVLTDSTGRWITSEGTRWALVEDN
jgi:hypothetical protein